MRPATEPGSGLSMLAARFVCPDTGCRAADGLRSAVPAPLGERPFGDTGGMQGGWGGAQPVHANLRAVASVAHIKAGGSQPGLVGWFAAIRAAPGETSG